MVTVVGVTLTTAAIWLVLLKPPTREACTVHSYDNIYEVTYECTNTNLLLMS